MYWIFFPLHTFFVVFCLFRCSPPSSLFELFFGTRLYKLFKEIESFLISFLQDEYCRDCINLDCGLYFFFRCRIDVFFFFFPFFFIGCTMYIVTVACEVYNIILWIVFGNKIFVYSASNFVNFGRWPPKLKTHYGIVFSFVCRVYILKKEWSTL